MTTTAGLPLAHADFAKPPLNIPNATGSPFKTELVVSRSPERTIKINWWHKPDDDRPPHSHPWDFTSRVLNGAITHRIWRLVPIDHGNYLEGKIWRCVDETWRAGESYSVTCDEFHLVTHVEPGTVTEMTCGRLRPAVHAATSARIGLPTGVDGVNDAGMGDYVSVGPVVPVRSEGEWGYLDPVTFTYAKATPDPAFMARLRAVNQWMIA